MLIIIQEHPQWKDEDEKGIIVSIEALERSVCKGFVIQNTQ